MGVHTIKECISPGKGRWNKVFKTSMEKGMVTRFWNHYWLLILSHLKKEPWPLFTVTISVDCNSFILIINFILLFFCIFIFILLNFKHRDSNYQLLGNANNSFLFDINIVVGSELNVSCPSYASDMFISEVLIDLCLLSTPPIPPSHWVFALINKKLIIDTKDPIDPDPPSDSITVHDCLIVGFCCCCADGHPTWRKHPLVRLHRFCSSSYAHIRSRRGTGGSKAADDGANNIGVYCRGGHLCI